MVLRYKITLHVKILLLCAILAVASTHFRRTGSVGAYKISPKPCRIGPEPESRTGTCMFVWECLKSEGKHLGMCADGFMFGSCCGHNDTTNDVHQVTTTVATMTSTWPVILDTSTTTTVLPSTSTTLEPSSSSTTTIVEPETIPLSPQLIPVEETLPFVTSNSSFFQPKPPKPPFQFNILTNSPPKEHATATTISTTTIRTTSIPQVTSAPTVSLSTTTLATEINEEEDFCGKAPLYPQMRIVGGKQSALGQFPWIASIRRTSFFGFSSTHRCGGALLNSLWVATAGHCVDDLLATQIRVRLGEWDFSGTDEKYPHVESTIVKKVVHPSYNFFTYENDLALLKLEKPIKFSKYIRPICLPGNQDLLIGENATVAGWGRLTENGQLPSRLQHVTVPIMSNAKCRELFLKSNRVEYIPDIFLCAGYEKGGQDSCQGDSGGPLQVKGRDGRYFLGGIISWGIGCAEANMPGVCTRISKFTDWIMANVT